MKIKLLYQTKQKYFIGFTWKKFISNREVFDCGHKDSKNGKNINFKINNLYLGRS